MRLGGGRREGGDGEGEIEFGSGVERDGESFSSRLDALLARRSAEKRSLRCLAPKGTPGTPLRKPTGAHQARDSINLQEPHLDDYMLKDEPSFELGGDIEFYAFGGDEGVRRRSLAREEKG